MKKVQLHELTPEGVAHDPRIMKRILLHESELPCSVRLSHATLTPGQQVSPHSHEDLYEIFYVLSGCGKFVVNGETLEVSEGSTILIDPGEVHEVINCSERDMSLLYFGLPGS